MYVSLSARMSDKRWAAISPAQRQTYLKAHPYSKYHPANVHHNDDVAKKVRTIHDDIEANPLLSKAQKAKFHKLVEVHRKNTQRIYNAALRGLRKSKGEDWYKRYIKALKDRDDPVHAKAKSLKRDILGLSHNTALNHLAKDKDNAALYRTQSIYHTMKALGNEQPITKSNAGDLYKRAVKHTDAVKRGGRASVHPETIRKLSDALKGTNFGKFIKKNFS